MSRYGCGCCVRLHVCRLAAGHFPAAPRAPALGRRFHYGGQHAVAVGGRQQLLHCNVGGGHVRLYVTDWCKHLRGITVLKSTSPSSRRGWSWTKRGQWTHLTANGIKAPQPICTVSQQVLHHPPFSTECHYAVDVAKSRALRRNTTTRFSVNVIVYKTQCSFILAQPVYTPWVKKQDPLLLQITSPNIERFSNSLPADSAVTV